MPEISYARVSPLAVTSAVCGVAPSLGLIVPPLALLSIVGVGTGLAAGISIRRYEIGGARLAQLGMIASVTFAVAVTVLVPLWHFVAFRLEAPSGFLRLNLRELTREGSQKSLDQYLEENVCLKGFALYGKSRGPMSEFCLSVDGDNLSTKNEVIMVELPPGQTWKWGENGIAVSGTLVRIRGPVRADKSYPKFKLTHAIVRRSLTGGRDRGGRRC
ncbi:MAG: hypothetical protein JWN70_6771 [Planctomycetaceae bacterium]|nr:hypothetical protein [Planctomycetaceae bacterium]